MSMIEYQTIDTFPMSPIEPNSGISNARSPSVDTAAPHFCLPPPLPATVFLTRNLTSASEDRSSVVIDRQLTKGKESRASLESKPCAVVLPEHLSDHGAWNVRRSILSPQELVSKFEPPWDNVRTLYDNFEMATQQYSKVEYLGTRQRKPSGSLANFKWLTFSEAGAIRSCLGAGLLRMGLSPKDHVGLYGVNCAEWVLCDHALHAYSMVSVPLYDTLGPDAVQYIATHANLRAICCSSAVLPHALDAAAHCPNLQLIVVWGLQSPFTSPSFAGLSGQGMAMENADGISSGSGSIGNSSSNKSISNDSKNIHSITNSNVSNTSNRNAHSSAPSAPSLPHVPHCHVMSFESLRELGQANRIPAVPPSGSDLALICYTSGTTGPPKGVMLTHGNLIANAAGSSLCFPGILPGHRYLSYLPLAHIYERVNHVLLTEKGCSIGFYAGDIATLLDDIQTLKPHVFSSVPRLYNRIFDKVLATVRSEKTSATARALFFRALAHKKRYLIKFGDPIGGRLGAIYDRVVFRKMRESLGGRVIYMITGASPLSTDVMAFLRCCFGAKVIEGYGMTESGCAISSSAHWDYSLGHVGGPHPSVEIKLVDIPEMRYTSKDVVDGIPTPRGEIWVRGPSVFVGYYKDPEQTKEALDLDSGWLHTGDVGAWLPGGRLKVVDRRKNLFKLAQGEYVAPERVEGAYSRSPFVLQSFVHGDSLRSTLVAIVVPDPDTALPWARSRYGGLTRRVESDNDSDRTTNVSGSTTNAVSYNPSAPSANVSTTASEGTEATAEEFRERQAAEKAQAAKDALKQLEELKRVCLDPSFEAEVFASMRVAAEEAGLKGFEQVKAIHLHPEPFSVENGLLTPTFKLKRPQAKAAFEEQIKRMYSKIEK